MTTLTAHKREQGKASKVRAAALLPAVVYGRKEKSTSISVPMREFEKALQEAGESTIVTLKGLGEDKNILIHDVSYDAVSGKPLHADFYAIEKGQTVEVSVPLEFQGVSLAVKDLGGILVKVMREIEIEGQPKDLPHTLLVSIEALTGLDSQIHVRDLVISPNLKIKAAPEEVVAMISVAKEEPVEEVAMDISQIETSVEKGKKDLPAEAGEEGAAGATGAPEKAEKKSQTKTEKKAEK